MIIKVLKKERLLKGILNTFTAVHCTHTACVVDKVGRKVSEWIDLNLIKFAEEIA